jgi:integrase
MDPGRLDRPKGDRRAGSPDYLGRRFSEVSTRLGLRHIAMKQLRHSHATALLVAGEHPKVVQERLGHSSIGITLDTYSAVLPNMQTGSGRTARTNIRGFIGTT